MYCDWSLKILTDLGCGFFDLGCRLNPGSFLLLFFVGAGLRVLQCGGFKWFIREFMGKSRVFRDGFFSKRFCNDGFLVKSEALKDSRTSSKANGDHRLQKTDDDDDDDDDEFHGANEDFEEEEVLSEDEVFSVIALRKMVKAEKRKANDSLKDLEKERMAAASAAEEAMAMIFRLQNEKSSLQIEANQVQRWAEEKQSYDEEVIQSLQCTLMQYEEDNNLLEEELKFYKKRLKVYEQDDENETFDCLSNSPCTPCLSESHLPGCKIDDLRIGPLDLAFASATLDPN